MNYNLLTHYGIDAQLTSLHFFKDEVGDIYLRAQGANYSSTAAISVFDSSFLKGEGITCSSKTCSDSPKECVPKKDKLSCTKCDWGTGDCTKSVTAVAIFYKELTISEVM